jgi:hypothetical protein
MAQLPTPLATDPKGFFRKKPLGFFITRVKLFGILSLQLINNSVIDLLSCWEREGPNKIQNLFYNCKPA